MKLGPKEIKVVNEYFVRPVKNRLKEIFMNKGLPQLKTADDIPQPPKKQQVEEIELFNEFNKRNPKADGGRIKYKDGSKQKFLVKVGDPKKENNVIEQKFQEVIGSKNRPETYEKTGVVKTLYKPQIIVKNKTVLTTDFGSKTDATDAIKKYREKNPIKNAPPDLETLDERKKKRYLDKKQRQADIKTRGGMPEGGMFSGDPEIHKGHAGNIKGLQMITGDKLIFTPAQINQAMAGKEGESRFTDLDYKIDQAEKNINKIKKSKLPKSQKKKLLEVQDNKLINYSAQSDGYKVVKLSNGTEYGGSFKKLQSIDPMDEFKNKTEREINNFVKKYKNVKVTNKTPKSEINNVIKTKIFLENLKEAKKTAARKAESKGMMLAANPMFNPGILKEAFKQLPTPAGAVGLNLLLGVDPTSAVDRASIAAEAAFAPQLVKQAAKLGTVGQKIANLGLTPAMAARAARIASPLGIASLAAEGLYQGGKFTKKRIEELRSMTPEQREELRRQGEAQAFDPFQAAGGGIAKQAGDRSGPMLKSMNPDKDGLLSLMKRGKKI